jgi:peptidoglycan/LPS O-acetylase OafA/YrhL
MALLLAGVLTVLGSAGDWAHCTTTGCDGFLQALSDQSGLEFGHGFVTGVAGILLAMVGLSAWRGTGTIRSRQPAVALALVIIATVATFIVGVYVLADGELHLWGPPGYGAILAGLGGVLGLVAGLRLRPSGRVGPAELPAA